MNRKSSCHESDRVFQAKAMLNKGTPMFVFDLETTGLSKKTDRVLSFSALKLTRKDGLLKEEDRMDLFINPGFHIPASITSINHISDDTVKGCPDETEAAGMIREFLGETPFLCGYNSSSFDEGFLRAMYGRVFGDEIAPCLHLDVYRMAKEKLDLPSYKLANVSRHLGADMGLEFHNSIDDVVATTRSLILLFDMYEDEKKEKKRTLRVKNAAYWNGPSARLKRIYVRTEPYSKTYYDIYRREWCSDTDVDLDELRSSVLAAYHADSETELLKKI